jgi:flagellar protein FlaG
MMTISNTTQVGEIERSIPPDAKQYLPPKPTPKESIPVLPEPKVETANRKQLKEVLAQSDISLNFSRDEKTGRVVVEMIDNATGDPVMQIPNEVSLRLSEMFSKVQGKLFEARF